MCNSIFVIGRTIFVRSIYFFIMSMVYLLTNICFFIYIYLIYTIGKSFLLKAIAHAAMEQGLNVCVSGPTGKLASTYAKVLPFCRCNTLHTNYFVPVGNTKGKNVINWSLTNVHVLLVDEVTINMPLSIVSYLLPKTEIWLKQKYYYKQNCIHMSILIVTCFQII